MFQFISFINMLDYHHDPIHAKLVSKIVSLALNTHCSERGNLSLCSLIEPKHFVMFNLD